MATRASQVGGSQPPKAKTPRAARPPKAKAPPPAPEAVAAGLLGGFPAGEAPRLWKEAELKRRLTPPERPALTAALARLREGRQVLALTQGKTTLYLFAEPLRGWLEQGTAGVDASTPAAGDLPAAYARLVRQSGGFPDVKIAALRAALGAGVNDRLVALWRAGQATFSQGDWSLADEETRAAAVELSGERYLLVRLEEVE